MRRQVTPWLDDLGGHVDGFDLTTSQRQGSPWFGERCFQGEEELVKIAPDQAVNILGGSRRRVESVLKQSSTLEEEQLLPVDVEGSLYRGDRH
jgi:hypothetical protein